MVEEIRYYYSKDGTVTEGPVSKAVLSQLFLDKVIDAESFVCREDESDWQPLDPNLFRSLSGPRGRRLAPPRPSSKKSRSRPNSVHRSAWYSDTNLLDPRFLRGLTTICFILTLGGALAAVHLRYVVFKNTLRAADTLEEVLGFFTGAAGLIFILPYLISLFFRHPWRRPALVVGILCAAVLLIWGEYRLFSSDAVRRAFFAKDNSTDVAESNVPWQILPNRYVDLAPALRNLQEIRAAASTDNTDMAIVRRDLIVVIDGLVAKLQACQDAAKACAPFNALTISSLDDINSRLDHLSALRDTQAELGNYLQATVANCREAVAKDDFSANTVDEAVSGFRKSARTDQLLQLANTTMKTSDDQITCLKILAQNWGRWHIDNGAILLDDPDALATYNTAMQSAQDDVTALHDLEKQ